MKFLPSSANALTQSGLSGPEALFLAFLVVVLAVLALTGTPAPDTLIVIATAASSLITRGRPGGGQLDGRAR
ncbi:hypothetical protein [Kitasatospora sp. NBC_01300]|uniref:hypothetical protein n=1 Tax=Kitasatospora sp. NBC_01300 TaxID=2903574 RepID=UPI00352D6201|nr:hypothetical protein OG556_16100 [Kitasatospora sp. NBC_01300]